MWQPIETAPKDQTFLAVLNCAGEQTICTMRWAVAEEKNSRPDHSVFHVERVTHWMPLPALPGAQPKLDEIKNALHRALELGKRETWTGAKKYRSREDQSEEQQCWVKVWNLLDAKGE